MDQSNQPLILVEEQFKLIADAAPVLIWASGVDKLYHFFNAGWLRFTGRTLEQEYGQGWIEGVHPNDRQFCLDIYASAFDARKEFTMEYRLKRHDGQYRWLVDNGVPRYLSDGTFAGYVGSCMDVDKLLESQRIKAEFISASTLQEVQALNEELASMNEELTAVSEEQAVTMEELTAANDELINSQESLARLNDELENRVALRTAELSVAQEAAEAQRDRLKRFFMQAPAGICILDGPAFIFELINPSYQQLFQNRELLGKPLLEGLPEIKSQPVWNILQEVYRTGISYEGKEVLIPLSRIAGGPLEDGFFNFTYQARRDDKGNIDGILVFVIEMTDTVLNRRRIEESEAGLRSMVMTSHYGLMILNGKDWKIGIANQQIANLWQKTLPEITGRKLLEVLPEIKDQPFPELLAKVYDTGTSYGQEEEILYLDSPDGTVQKFVSFYYNPMLDSAGKVTGIIVACEDVTEKVKARQMLEKNNIRQQALNEELSATNKELIETQGDLQRKIKELAESETRFRNLVLLAPVGICMIKGDPFYVQVINDTFLELVRRKRTDFDHQSYWGVIPEAAAYYEPIMYQVMATGETYYAKEHEVKLLKNGIEETIYVDFVYEPIRNSDGVTDTILIVANEVTEQVLSRKKVERAEESLRMAIDAAELGAYYINAQDRIFVASPRLKEFFGFGPDEEVPYEAAINQIHPDYRQAAADLVEDSFTKGTRFDMEYPVVGYHDGKIRWVRGIGTMQHDSNGDSYFTGVLHEITEKKQDEMRKNDFIGMVSHELKTPLTSLTAIIQVANVKLKNSEDAFLSGAMSKANIQVKKMSSMINGFLNISRLESGKIHMDKQDFDLSELISEVIDEAMITVSSHTISFLPGNVVPIYADRNKIGSVISNLLSNAVKYSPKGKLIGVTCETVGNEVMVSVKDEGMGIKPQDIGKLFDRYYRVENSNTQLIAGFGIGLYLSAEIIHRHDGKIWVESKPGEGATFHFRLPLPVI